LWRGGDESGLCETSQEKYRPAIIKSQKMMNEVRRILEILVVRRNANKRTTSVV